MFPGTPFDASSHGLFSLGARGNRQICGILTLDFSAVLSLSCLNDESVNLFNELSAYLACPVVLGVFVWLVYRQKVWRLRSKLAYVARVHAHARTCQCVL